MKALFPATTSQTPSIIFRHAIIGISFLLLLLATKYPKNELRLRAYGNSVILQGSFLFFFDLVMYGLLRSHRADFLQLLSFSPMQDAWGLALTFQFLKA